MVDFRWGSFGSSEATESSSPAASPKWFFRILPVLLSPVALALGISSRLSWNKTWCLTFSLAELKPSKKSLFSGGISSYEAGAWSSIHANIFTPFSNSSQNSLRLSIDFLTSRLRIWSSSETLLLIASAVSLRPNTKLSLMIKEEPKEREPT